MNAIVEIDKAGRLVVPKKIRDELHLVPGTRLSLQQSGQSILLEPERKPRGLYRKNGMLVYDSGRPVPQDVVTAVHEAREARSDQLFGEALED